METDQPTMQLTSTTAPGKLFASRAELAEHYKSDWHKYNLKRREAQMVMLTFEEFSARLEAAMALRRERENKDERTGTDHLKKDKKNIKSTNNNDHNNTSITNNSKSNNLDTNQRISKRKMRQNERNGIIPSSTAEKLESQEEQSIPPEDNTTTTTEMEEDEPPPEINPKQSLFDKHIFQTVQDNVDYMYKKYGFFIPDIECLIDLEGLVGYCAEKVKLGHTCLYCQKMFTTWKGCQLHMINTRHSKLRYEAGVDLDEFDVFYDFSADNEEFMNSGIGNHKKKKEVKGKNDNAMQEDDASEEEEEEEDDDSGEWEDVDSDEEMDEEEEEDGLYAAYQDEIAKHGFDITPLGELIFPDGRIIGHRGLARYYKQRITPEKSVAVMAARKANADRLYKGRLYNLYNSSTSTPQQQEEQEQSILALRKAGLNVSTMQGRLGNGILVSHNSNNIEGEGKGGFTALSLYRFKAAVKKARIEESKGRRLQHRTTLPMNKMDKKANRLFNNVSVAHAKR